MIKPYDQIGEDLTFGGITISFCAMPRRMDRLPPRGEPYYPFKLGYRFVTWIEYVKMEDVYRFVVWQLLFEKKVRFLDAEGKVCAIKDNSHWKADHLEPLLKLLETAKSNLHIDVMTLLEKRQH